MSFFASIGAPIAAKDAKESSEPKIKLTINKKAPSILSLFEDVIDNHQAKELCTNKKKITFIYHNQIPVYILISKDATKIRI